MTGAVEVARRVGRGGGLTIRVVVAIESTRDRALLPALQNAAPVAGGAFVVTRLVVLVLLQSALYVHALQVVRSAAQEGARAAAADGASLAVGQTRARALLGAGLGRSGQLLNVTLSEDAQGVQLTVSGSMGLLTAGPVEELGLPIRATARSTREAFVPSGGAT